MDAGSANQDTSRQFVRGRCLPWYRTARSRGRYPPDAEGGATWRGAHQSKTEVGQLDRDVAHARSFQSRSVARRGRLTRLWSWMSGDVYVRRPIVAHVRGLRCLPGHSPAR